MSVLDVSNMKLRTRCWFPNAIKRAALTPAQKQAIDDWVQVHIFEAAAARKDGKMNVTEALRLMPNHPDWTGSVLQPLYDNTLDDVEAARIYGNIVCEVGIKDHRNWWCFPEPVGDYQFSRSYVLDSKLNKNPFK